jgi:HEAT repeat protein
MSPDRLLAVAADPEAAEPMRFFAAKQLCAGEPDAATIEKLLTGKDPLVQLIAVESLKTREQIKAQLPLLTKLRGGKYGFFGGPIRDAVKRGGPEFLGDLADFARSNPASFSGIVEMFSVTPGSAATQQLVNLMTDTTLKDQQRVKAAQTLGWRKDATKEQEDAILAYLLPLLNDPKTRTGTAALLHPPYVWQHGLWHKDPRVLEAAKAALAAEEAQPEPNKEFMAPLQKIIKGQQ